MKEKLKWVFVTTFEGDVRIKKIGENYVWIKSPWDDGLPFDKIQKQ